MLALARQLGHPSTLAMTYHHAALGYNLRPDASVAQELAEAGISLASKHGLGLWIACVTLQLGCALTESGQAAKTILLSQDGTKATKATGSTTPYSVFCSLAEACGKTG